MQTAAKVGIGVGMAAATAATVAWAKVAGDDAAANRNNDRNSLINVGLFVGAASTGVAGAVTRHLKSPAAPWLFAATAVLGANALASTFTAENGWERSGIAYCNFGICNRTAVGEHGTPNFYTGPNPLGDTTTWVDPG